MYVLVYFLVVFFILDTIVTLSKTQDFGRLITRVVYVTISLISMQLYFEECENEKLVTQQVVSHVPTHADGIFCEATFYNATDSQCDSDPLITASQDTIDLQMLNSYKLRWIAISRDLRDFYNFHDSVFVESDNKSIEGWWIVKDLMSSRWKRRVDFLLPEGDTLNVGKTTVRLLLNK